MESRRVSSSEDILQGYFPFRVDRIAERLKEEDKYDLEVREVFERAKAYFERIDEAHGNLCAELIKIGRYERQRDDAPLPGHEEYERELWAMHEESPVEYLEKIASGYIESTMEILDLRVGPYD
jgi:hypothetical protein